MLTITIFKMSTTVKPVIYIYIDKACINQSSLFWVYVCKKYLSLVLYGSVVV